MCTGGFFLNRTQCYMCLAGFICDAGTTNATNMCEEGTDNTTQLNVKCTVGYFCDAGTSNATKVLCPAGYYCGVGENSTTMQLCPERFMCAAGTTPLTRKDEFCLEGYMCNKGTSNATKRRCPAGSVCYEATFNETLIDCAAGYICAEGTTPKNQYDMACPAGYICDAGTTPSTQYENPCPAGFVCPAGSSSYYCEAGSTPDAKKKCPPGYDCPEQTTKLPQKSADEASFDFPTEFKVAMGVFGVAMLLDVVFVLYARCSSKHHQDAKYLFPSTQFHSPTLVFKFICMCFFSIPFACLSSFGVRLPFYLLIPSPPCRFGTRCIAFLQVRRRAFFPHGPA